MYPASRAQWHTAFEDDARALSRVLPAGSVDLTFIDANHSHPYPLLDLLQATAFAKPGSWVILHDVDLPIQHPQFQTYGPRWLFHAWPFNKVKAFDRWASIAAVQLPEDPSLLVPMALALLEMPWEQDICMETVALPPACAAVQAALEARLRLGSGCVMSLVPSSLCCWRGSAAAPTRCAPCCKRTRRSIASTRSSRSRRSSMWTCRPGLATTSPFSSSTVPATSGRCSRTGTPRRSRRIWCICASLTSKSRIVLDVKYNSTHHVTDAWREMAEPTLFTLLQSQGIGVLHLTRRNLLRCLVSMLKAFESRRFHSTDGQPPADRRFSLAPQWALKKMTAWAVEDDLVATAFDGYAFYKRIDYADLFPDARGTLDEKALADLAAWFEVPNAFSNQPTFTKLSSLPLDQTIENFEDVSAVLRGTPFEACLDDEPAYRLPVDVQH